MLLPLRKNNALSNPHAPRASIYSADIPNTYYRGDVPDVSNACDLPHAVSTPEIVDAAVTLGDNTANNAASVIEGFNIYGYMLIFITVILIIGFLLDRR